MLKNRIKRWLENYPNVYAGRLSKKNLFRSLTSNSRILPDFIIIGESKCSSIDGSSVQNNKISSSLTSLATINTNISGIGFKSNNSDSNTKFYAKIFRLL